MADIFSDDERCKIITIMHSIWSSRNRWTHDKDGYDPIQVIKWEHETLSLMDLPVGRTRAPVDQCWRPPNPGWVTINTDGGINGDAMNGGAGGVVRSHLVLLTTWSKTLPRGFGSVHL
jgi:hypothetical protein